MRVFHSPLALVPPIVLSLALAVGSSSLATSAAPQEPEERFHPQRIVNSLVERRRAFGKLRSTVRTSITSGVRWLLAHQAEDGSWSSAKFMHTVEGKCTCTGPGLGQHNVGVSGLALLAVLAGGDVEGEPEVRDAVDRAIDWIIQQQDKRGLIGAKRGHTFLYDHAVATLALAEGFALLGDDSATQPLQAAVRYIESARNPIGAWRYDVPPVGAIDTSVTGWMTLALLQAREAGAQIDTGAFDHVLAWLEEVTDPANGRIGYQSMGSLSSRISGINDHFPPEKGEALTSLGLLTYFFLGQEPKALPVMDQHAALVLKALPEWDKDGFGCDMYHWYYGSQAMYQMGGRAWKSWTKALERALLAGQTRKNRSKRSKAAHAHGSWDPIGPWGVIGGRVYSTAMPILSLTASVRYRRLSAR